MNLDTELRKPVILQGGKALTLAQARNALPQADTQRLASQPRKKLDSLIAERALINLKTQSQERVRQLIIERLRSTPSAEFRFLDGTLFTGAQAAQAVARGTRKGRFFFALEKRTLKIVLELIRSGENAG